jgi:methyltransferase (TIGR00027 family)
MEEGRPSSTAVAAAMMRAAHLLWDDEPKILKDELALGLSGIGDEATLRATLDVLLTEMARDFSPDFAQAIFRHFRAMAVLRSRYVEDELARALTREVRQLVILGAGFDSFAYRRQDLASTLHVFEVDHPTSQRWKLDRLNALQVGLPPNLRFIALDFEKHALVDSLRVGGYRLEEPAFFSWLGVTQYLTEAAVYRTLQEVASLAAGTEIVFMYVVPVAMLDDENQRLLTVSTAGSAARGEPWLSFFEPARLAARVQELGFAEVWDLGPEEANARYFSGRGDGLRVANIAHLMKARVGGPVRSLAGSTSATER